VALRAFTVAGGGLALVALLVLAASGGAEPHRVASAAVLAVPAGSRTPAPPPPRVVLPGEAHAAPRLLQGESRTTLQGDDIDDAIATYGIDDGGNLYEVHSPQTEVPALGNPST